MESAYLNTTQIHTTIFKSLHYPESAMLKKLYSGPIEKVSKKLGLHPHVVRIYRVGRNPKKWYQIRTKETYPAQIKKISAEFSVSNYSEARRIEKLSHNEELRLLLDELKNNDVYWDIGANIGTHSIFPAKILSDGKVLSIEPHPNNIRSLKKNIRMNKLEDRIDVKEVALGNKKTTVELNVEGGGYAGSGGHSIVTNEGEEYIEVPMITGDSLLNEYMSPNVIKIDVQAAELSVLHGLSEAMTDSCRVVFCEVHRRRGVDVSKITDFFEENGFVVNVPEDSGNTVQLVAKSE